jgi:hypothetical protein
MSRDLRFNILVRENFDRALSAGRTALNGFLGFAGGIAQRLRGMLNLRNILVGGGVIGGLAATVRAAFGVETIETQFKVLLGSAEEAKKRIRELQEFSASTPFQLSDIAEASRQLHVFSQGAMGGAESLRSIGDAAAATGQGINEVAFWVGRAYAAIQGGQPFGQAAMRLQQMGIMTPKVAAEMQRLQASGASAEQVFAVLQGRLGEFDGGMDALSKTGSGLVSTLKDNWSLALADFGKAFMDLSKEGIQGLIDRIQQLREDGTIERWAERSASAARVLASILGDIFGGDQEERAKALGDMGQLVVAMFYDAGHAFLDVVKPGLETIWDNIKKGATRNAASMAEAAINPGAWLGRRIGRAAGGAIIGAAEEASQSGTRESLLAARISRMLEERGRAEQPAESPEAQKPDAESTEARIIPNEVAEPIARSQIALGEIFTRLQDGLSPEERGTRSNPMFVSVTQFEGGEG